MSNLQQIQFQTRHRDIIEGKKKNQIRNRTGCLTPLLQILGTFGT